MSDLIDICAVQLFVTIVTDAVRRRQITAIKTANTSQTFSHTVRHVNNL